MERRRNILTVLVACVVLTVVMSTLLSCSSNSGQVAKYPFDNQEYMQRFTLAIYQLGKAIERHRCLSTDIKVASDTNTCFDCHDKIVR